MENQIESGFSVDYNYKNKNENRNIFNDQKNNENEIDLDEINENINSINIDNRNNKVAKKNNLKGGNQNGLNDKVQDKEKDRGKIFVGGLTYNTTDEILEEYFSKFDKITDCVVMKDDSGCSRGFGFLTFTHPELLDSVLKKRHTIDGKVVDAKRAIPREEQDKTEKIFVGGIQTDITEEKFKEAFEKYGKVIDATLIIAKETGKSRGFGFITYEDEKGANKAYDNQKEILLNGKQVEVRHAIAKAKTSGTNKALMNINTINNASIGVPMRMDMGMGMGMGMNILNRPSIVGPARNHHSHAYPELQQQYPRYNMYAYNYSPFISTSYIGYNGYGNGYEAQTATLPTTSEYRGYGGTEIPSYYRGIADARYNSYNGYNVNMYGGGNFIPQRIPTPNINSIAANGQYMAASTLRNTHGYHPYSR